MPNVNNFLSATSTGLYCPQGDFYIDPKRPVHRALVSHAHGDHAVPNSGKVYCTRPTRLMMSKRFSRSLRSEFVDVEFRSAFTFGEVNVTYYPAGHMLGSAQILMEYQGERYLYTGDFKLQSDKSCEDYEFVSCDHLITETTFADPEYVHPDPVAAVLELNETRQNVVIGAYAIGKSQRLTRMISDACPSKTLYIHSELTDFHHIYEREGKHLGKWQNYSRQGFNETDNNIMILPPHLFMRYSRNKSVIRMFATGWKRAFQRCDRVLPVSDHADWNDVLKVVSRSGARKVYTVHGKGDKLKAHLETEGIEVQIVSK